MRGDEQADLIWHSDSFAFSHGIGSGYIGEGDQEIVKIFEIDFGN